MKVKIIVLIGAMLFGAVVAGGALSYAKETLLYKSLEDSLRSSIEKIAAPEYMPLEKKPAAPRKEMDRTRKSKKA